MKPRVLCVDAGNSFVKFSVGEKPWHDLGRLPTDAIVAKRPALKRLLGGRRDAGIESVWVSSVVPGVNRWLTGELRSATGLKPVVVDHTFQLPFRLRVKRPEMLGVDRLCAAAGAVRSGRKSVIVIDVGSAITVDLVDAGAYRGGLILRGPATGLRWLGARTRKLPAIDFDTVDKPFPPLFGDTRASMILGASLGAVGAIREATAVLRKAATGKPTVVLTGGGSAALGQRLPGSWRLEPRLVCQGLLHIRRLNSNRG